MGRLEKKQTKRKIKKMGNKALNARSNEGFFVDPLCCVIQGYDPHTSEDHPQCDPESNNGPGPSEGMISSVGVLGNVQQIELVKAPCSPDDPNSFIGLDGKREPYMTTVNIGRWRVRAARIWNERHKLSRGDEGYVLLKARLAGRYDSEIAAAHRQLAENHHRREVNPIDEAKNIWRLHTVCRMPLKELADTLGISVTSVHNKLSLNTLTPEISEQVRAGEIKPSAAFEVAKAATPELQAEALSVANAATNNQPRVVDVKKAVEAVNATVDKGVDASTIQAKKIKRPKVADIQKMLNLLTPTNGGTNLHEQACATLRWALGEIDTESFVDSLHVESLFQTDHPSETIEGESKNVRSPVPDNDCGIGGVMLM